MLFTGAISMTRMMLLLFVLLLLVTLNVASATVVSIGCRETQRTDTTVEYCCTCETRFYGGACISTQKTTCSRYTNLNPSAETCGRGEWGCSTPYMKNDPKDSANNESLDDFARIILHGEKEEQPQPTVIYVEGAPELTQEEMALYLEGQPQLNNEEEAAIYLEGDPQLNQDMGIFQKDPAY